MKTIKLIVSFLLVVVFTLAAYSHSNVAHAKKKLEYSDNSLLALNYHRVRNESLYNNFLLMFSNSKELKNYSVSSKQLDSQIKWLKQHHARFLTLNEVMKYKKKGKFPKRSVWINFDDMDQSIYDNAYPILKKHKVPSTGFVITQHVGSKDFHNLNLVDINELKEMKNSGLWDFASHSNNLHDLQKHDNPKFLTASHKQLTADIKDSNQYLHQTFNINNKAIAYPYGQMDRSSITAVKQAGIKYGFTLEEEPIRPDTNNYLLPRILVNQDSFNKLIKRWDGFHDKEK